MTTTSDSESILVCGPRPEFDVPRMVLSLDGPVAFDGSRFDCPLELTYLDEERQLCRRPSAVAVARQQAVSVLRARSPEYLVLERPTHLWAALPGTRGRRLSARLRATAFEMGTTVVGWRPAGPDPRVDRHYGEVIDRTDSRVDPGARG